VKLLVTEFESVGNSSPRLDQPLSTPACVKAFIRVAVEVQRKIQMPFRAADAKWFYCVLLFRFFPCRSRSRRNARMPAITAKRIMQVALESFSNSRRTTRPAML